MIRFRNFFMLGGSAVVLAYLFWSDPSEGASTVAFLASLATPVIAVFFAHLARKGLFDYLDMKELLLAAKKSATGAGLVFLGVCVVLAGLLGLFGSKAYAQDVRTYIPAQAYVHMPTLRKEVDLFYADHPKNISLPA